jgi:hypothetical protein
VILAAEALGAVRAAELPVTRVHHAEQNNKFWKEKNKRFTINHWRMYRMWNCGSSFFSSIDPDPESGFAINLEVEATFDSDPDPRIHTAGFRILIRLLLFSSVIFKMVTKNKFLSFLLTKGTFTLLHQVTTER